MKTEEMVVSLRKGVKLKDVCAYGTLADFLQSAAVLEIIDGLPTGTVAKIKIEASELEKLKGKIGDRCHIVPFARGRVDI